jgi:hypothetical protein
MLLHATTSQYKLTGWQLRPWHIYTNRDVRKSTEDVSCQTEYSIPTQTAVGLADWTELYVMASYVTDVA